VVTLKLVRAIRTRQDPLVFKFAARIPGFVIYGLSPSMLWGSSRTAIAIEAQPGSAPG
jgi:hypothetical protein